jgi:hypothetical protein
MTAMLALRVSVSSGNAKKGKYHCTVDLLFDWFGISSMTTEFFLFLLEKETNPNPSNRRLTVQ